MKIFRNILIGLMVILSLAVGNVILLIYFGVIDFYSLSQSSQIAYTILMTLSISLIAIPCLFIMTLIIHLIRNKDDFKFLQNLGEVIVSKKAILNFVTKQISKKNFVKKVYPRVKINRNQDQCSLILNVWVVSAGSSIKELTHLLQQDVKEAVENTIGIKLLNIRIVINEIND